MDRKLIGNIVAGVMLAAAVILVPWVIVGFALQQPNPQDWPVLYRLMAVAGMGAMATGLLVLLMPDSYRGG